MLTMDTGYKLYTEAANMPDSHRYLHVRLQIERQRFLNFSLEAGILDADGVLCSALQINRSLLLAVLAEIKILFESYAAANGRYETSHTQFDPNEDGEPRTDLIGLLCVPTQVPSPSSSEQLPRGLRHLGRMGKDILRTGRRLRTVVIEPKRLVWSAVDKESFTQLISKLENLNSFLISLLDSSQIKRLQDTVNTTYLEILQIRCGMDSLTALVKALSPANIPQQGSGTGTGALRLNYQPFQTAILDEVESEVRRREYVRRLAELKIKYTRANMRGNETLEGDRPRRVTNLLLDLKDFVLEEVVLQGIGQNLPRRMPATFHGTEVWIEWKRKPNGRGAADSSMVTEDRVAALTELLGQDKPDGFRSPTCIGYVKKEILDLTPTTYFGIVYKKPLASATDGNPHILSLRDLLLERSKPSLTQRMTLCGVLARCIHTFHAISWLHKGLRSDNILFFGNTGAENVQLTLPFVTGFEFSRPGIIDEMTEKPEFDPFEDIYRHPKAQSGQLDGSYRSNYDVYSLGVIFIEIAFWKRIEEVVGFKNLAIVKPSTIRRVKPWLLGLPFKEDAALTPICPTTSSCVERLAPECGTAFRDIVERCLRADDMRSEGTTEQLQSHGNLELQRMMEKHIVKRLEGIANAL